MEFCVCSTFCCTLLCFLSRFKIVLRRKRKLVALFCLSSWCGVIVMWIFLMVTSITFIFLIILPHLSSFRVFLKSSTNHQNSSTHLLFKPHRILNWDYFSPKLNVLLFNAMQSKKGGKDQESILSSTTPDPGYHMEK